MRATVSVSSALWRCAQLRPMHRRAVHLNVLQGEIVQKQAHMSRGIRMTKRRREAVAAAHLVGPQLDKPISAACGYQGLAGVQGQGVHAHLVHLRALMQELACTHIACSSMIMLLKSGACAM